MSGRRLPFPRMQIMATPLPALLVLLTIMSLLVAPVLGCMPEGTVNSVTIGKKTFVCLTDGKKFTLLEPAADRYARITVPNTFTKNKGGCQNQRFSIQSMGVTADFTKAYCSDTSWFFPILVAVINVDKGRVTGITWNDGCYFTDSKVPISTQQCRLNAFDIHGTALSSVPAPAVGKDTALTLGTCNKENSKFCDFTVYITWTGTDASGNYFSSSGRRFETFRSYALQPQFQAMQMFL